MTTHAAEIDRLYQQRPRSMFLRGSFVGTIGLGVAAWLSLDLGVLDLLSPRRLANLQRFCSELVPFELRDRGFHPVEFGQWVWRFMETRGWEALFTTLWIAVAAIVLAGIGGFMMMLPAARTLAHPDPFSIDHVCESRRSMVGWSWWRLIPRMARAVLILLRALPEYIWAFFLVAILGGTAWAAVLALALHNVGILGKLGAETIEDIERTTPAALRALGATRLQTVFVAVVPMILPRLLVYFFYRWETCVRESTVLGLLGLVSLGYWIQDARARSHYDEMMLLVLLGALLILLGDVVSSIARKWVRQAG